MFNFESRENFHSQIPIVLIAPLMQLILCGKLHWSRYETLVYCVKGEILLKLELSTVLSLKLR